MSEELIKDVDLDTGVTPKLFTEDEVKKMLTAEVDRRVDSGIKKGLDTQKQKWEIELNEKAKLTAEELAQKEYEDKLKEVSSKEREINKRANKIDAKDMLSDAGIPKSQYDKVINMLVSDDADTTKENVTNFINVFNDTKTEIETKVKSEYANVPKPKTGEPDVGFTKEAFLKMSYADTLAFKQTNPDLYKEYMK